MDYTASVGSHRWLLGAGTRRRTEGNGLCAVVSHCPITHASTTVVVGGSGRARAPSRTTTCGRSAEDLPQRTSSCRLRARVGLRNPFSSPALRARPLPRLPSRGPIEAISSSPVFPDFARFRGFRAAAPLKPDRIPRSGLEVRRFRGFRAAAPLKPRNRYAQFPREIKLPRLPSRGPIEASRLSSLPGLVLSLPRLPSRGPIEARCSRVWRGSESCASAASEPRPH